MRAVSAPSAAASTSHGPSPALRASIIRVPGLALAGSDPLRVSVHETEPTGTPDQTLSLAPSVTLNTRHTGRRPPITVNIQSLQTSQPSPNLTNVLTHCHFG